MDKFRQAMLKSVISDLISADDITNGRFNEEIDNYLENLSLNALQAKHRQGKIETDIK